MRRPFSGTPDAWAMGIDGLPLPGRDEGGNVIVAGTVWTDQTGGTQITDLTFLDGNPIADDVIVPDQHGRIPRFLGPDDDTARIWLDFGLDRVMMLATDDPERILAVETSLIPQYVATAVVYANNFRNSRPLTNSTLLSWTCDGVDDQSEINAAVEAVAALGGGQVLLLGGSFHISGTVARRTLVKIRGLGWATRIFSTADFQAGMFELADEMVHLSSLESMWIHGQDYQVHGVKQRNNSGEEFVNSSPDPVNNLHDLRITNCGNSSFPGTGVILSGGNCRATQLTNSRINECTGNGVWLDGAPDNFLDLLDIGSCGKGTTYSAASGQPPVGHGVAIYGDSNNISNVKAWYCRGAGFIFRGVRTTLTGGSAQDNYSYGYDVRYGKNSLSNFLADSNGQVQILENDTTGRGTAGINAPSELNNITNFQSFDRDQASHGWTQQTGVVVGSGTTRSLIQGTTYGNATASVSGTAGVETTINVKSDANGK